MDKNLTTVHLGKGVDMGGTKEGDFEGNTPSQIMAAERNWIEEQDKNLPIVIMKTASECFKREFCKIRAEAKEKFIAKSIAKFGKEKLEEMLEKRRDYIFYNDKDIKKYEAEISIAFDKCIDAFEKNLKTKIKNRTRTRRGW